MKKIHTIVLIVLAIFVSGCDTNDDRFYNNVYADASNLVTLDSHPATFSLGEKLYVNATIPKLLPEGSRFLDVRQTTGADAFTFTYLIEKETTPGNWNYVAVNDSQLDIVKGNAQNNPYVLGICEYNSASGNYEFRVGFPLLSAGNYRMSYGYNSDSLNSVELVSESPTGRLMLTINSLVTGLDAQGYYRFTVN